LARSISAFSSRGVIAPTTPAVTRSCRSKTSSRLPSKRSAHRWLPCDARPVRRLAHAAFEHVTDAELLSHSLHVDGAPLVDEARITRDDEQPAHPRQRGDNVFDDAVGKVFLLGIAARTLIGAVQPFLDSASKCNASIWSMALHRGYDPCCNGGASQHPEKENGGCDGDTRRVAKNTGNEKGRRHPGTECEVPHERPPDARY
jgi:hypothetical protein